MFKKHWTIIVIVIFIAICAVYVTRFFEVKKKSSMILIPAVMATFPAVAATMSYMYTVDGYMLGLLLAILAAYISRKYNVNMSVRQCQRLFHSLGYSHIRPQPYPSKGYEDSEARNEFKKNVPN